MRLRIQTFRVMVLVLAAGFSCAALLGCARQVIHEAQEFEGPVDFLLGPEDVLEITVWKNQELSRTVAIRPDGRISMPVIGDVQASGSTVNALAQQISERFKPFVTNPVVSVSVKDLNSYAVFVLGEVAKPGKFQLKSYTTVLQAITMAGGFTEFAKKNRLHVVRNKPNGDRRRHEIRIQVRYDDLVAGQGEPGNFVLKPGDTVVVP